MSTRKFELIYGFVHCKGKSVYIDGIVDTEEEAKSWMRRKRHELEQNPDAFRDASFECKVAVCPMKECIPYFDYRETRA